MIGVVATGAQADFRIRINAVFVVELEQLTLYDRPGRRFVVNAFVLMNACTTECFQLADHDVFDNGIRLHGVTPRYKVIPKCIPDKKCVREPIRREAQMEVERKSSAGEFLPG
jgi:hypothetical protein